MPRGDNNKIKLFKLFEFSLEVFEFCNEFLASLVKPDVVSYGAELDVVGNGNERETSQEIVPQKVTRQVRRHGPTIEVTLERIVRVLKTLFGCVCPQVLVC